MTIDSKDSEKLGGIILQPDTQTRIASFLISIKQQNVAILSRFELQQMEWIPYTLLHGQLFREMELIGLLQRMCEWSTNPAVYLKISETMLRVSSELRFNDYLFAPVAADVNFYRYLALSQALFAYLRFTRVLPLEVPLEHKFLALLRSLETIHGQQMQGQIMMLRNFPIDLTEEERENIVGEESARVLKVFEGFITELVEQKSPEN